MWVLAPVVEKAGVRFDGCLIMRITHKQGPEMCNLDILERLASAWNPPDVEAVISIADGSTPHTFHLCVTGTADGRQIQVFGNALHKCLLCQPEHRLTLARGVRDFFETALTPPPEMPSRSVTYC